MKNIHHTRLVIIFVSAMTALMAAQTIPAGQKLKVTMGKAVAFSSGAPDADSVAIADVNGDGIPTSS
jgi:hypothetical protein